MQMLEQEVQFKRLDFKEKMEFGGVLSCSLKNKIKRHGVNVRRRREQQPIHVV